MPAPARLIFFAANTPVPVIPPGAVTVPAPARATFLALSDPVPVNAGKV